MVERVVQTLRSVIYLEQTRVGQNYRIAGERSIATFRDRADNTNTPSNTITVQSVYNGRSRTAGMQPRVEERVKRSS